MHSDSSMIHAIQDFVCGLMDALESADISYCLLRNRKHIPLGLIQGGDIDLCVSSSTSSRKIFSAIEPLRPVQIICHRDVIITWYMIAPGVYVRVDFVHIDLEWKGAVFFSNDRILKSAIADDGILTASRTHEEFIKWMQNILAGGTFKARYEPSIMNAANDDPVGFQKLLTDTLGMTLGGEYWGLVNRREIAQSVRLVARTRRVVWLRALRKRPGQTIVGLVDRYRQELSLRLRIRPAGLMITVLGPDGSGKSSVCEGILDSPKCGMPFSGRHHVHLFKRILPDLGDIAKGHLIPRNDQSTTTEDPHASPPNGPLVSTLRLLYLTFSSWVSEFAWARHQLSKNAIIVGDRHLVDVVVDPLRFRYGGSRRIGHWLSRLAPQPDLFILLNAPPEVLQQRKQEVPFAETARQVVAYRELAESMNNVHVVDASQSVDDVVAEINHIILDFLEVRAHRSLGMKALSHG